MSLIIDASKISKKYIINHEKQGGYTTLVETLSKKASNALRRVCHPFQEKKDSTVNLSEEYWALRDINLKIYEGDRVGIIGRNGAGKSTLLKILSRITEPTTGFIKVKGRISSLLEVGTGFHPELTGRENIFLNGAILGMKHQEIKRKFDEIVAFSEIEKFLDMPVKRYSSGMYMRLGFAIAAHLDSDLLIVDEVLAVGDAKFQEKCLKKLNDLSGVGRTVLFVSHDIGSILGLCNKGILLEKGQLKLAGSIEECVTNYMRTIRQHGLTWSGDEGDERIRFYRASLVIDDMREFFYQDDIVRIEIEYEVMQPIQDLILGIGVWSQRNQLLARSHTWDKPEKLQTLTLPGKKKAVFSVNANLFHEGDYVIRVDCFIHNVKKILGNEISLKFPVYARRENAHLCSSIDSSGVSLGYTWELAKDPL